MTEATDVMIRPQASTRRFPAPDGKARIIPSLLAADFGNLAGALRMIEEAGTEWASVDVMDGHFVPNLSFGPDHLRALRPKTGMILDAHLMVDDPALFAPLFAEAGADLIIAHLETLKNPRALLKKIRSSGAAAGLAIKPATPVSAVTPYLGDADFVLVMTVEPGFGGQAFIDKMLPKIRAIRRDLDRRKLGVWLGADGGIHLNSVARAADAGADALVAGTAIFGKPDPKAAFQDLLRTAQTAFEQRS